MAWQVGCFIYDTLVLIKMDGDGNRETISGFGELVNMI